MKVLVEMDDYNILIREEERLAQAIDYVESCKVINISVLRGILTGRWDNERFTREIH